MKRYLEVKYPGIKACNNEIDQQLNIAVMTKKISFLTAFVFIMLSSWSSTAQIRNPQTADSHSSKTNPGSADLASIDPGSFDNTWWNRMPYRLVQTNLREIDATMDIAAYVKSMVDASANI